MARELAPVAQVHFISSSSGSVEATRYSSDVNGLRKLTLIGLLIVGLFFGTLIAWVTLAELSSAAIAPGVVRVSTNLKTIQHLERGLVDQIHVREGDEVEANQTLLRLDGTDTLSKLELLRWQKYSAMALIARLSAERDGLDVIDIPEELRLMEDSSKREELIRVQQDIFSARHRSLATKEDIIFQRIDQYESEVKGLKAQLGATNLQLRLYSRELKDMQRLLERQLIPVSKPLEIEHRIAQVKGQRGNIQADIARAGQRIAEARLEAIDLHETMGEQAALQLREARHQLNEAEEKIPALEDAARRLDIRAPIDGTVVNMQVHTVGGVVGPGDALMEIVPKNDVLVVEAKINPIDIDVVRPGLLANVTLTAHNRRSNEPIQARVLWVSADLLSDSRTGQSYFLARLELVEPQESIESEKSLSPGMLAEVTILTGKNTYLEFLWKPIRRNLSRAFRDG